MLVLLRIMNSIQVLISLLSVRVKKYAFYLPVLSLFYSIKLYFPAPKPENISCSASDSSIDITWQQPGIKCSFTGLDVAWTNNVLWKNKSGSGADKLVEVNSFSVQGIIPFAEYSVCVATLVFGHKEDEFAWCSVETPEKRKFLYHSKFCTSFS